MKRSSTKTIEKSKSILSIPVLLILWLIIFALWLPTPKAHGASHDNTEAFYAVPYCQSVHGENGGKPVRMTDGTYADCITAFGAVEVDFVNKYYECYMQAIHYSNMTGKQPVCALIIEKGTECYLYRRARDDFGTIPIRMMLVNIGPVKCTVSP